MRPVGCKDQLIYLTVVFVEYSFSVWLFLRLLLNDAYFFYFFVVLDNRRGIFISANCKTEF